MKKRLFGLLGLLLILCMLASCAAEGGGLETTGDAQTVTDVPDGTTDGDATELPDGETGATEGDATTGENAPTVTPPADGVLEFSLLADGTYAVVGMGADFSGECLVIPETVDGIPVTAIGENAFAGRREIFEVVIPATVQTIEKGAFADVAVWDGAQFRNTATYSRSHSFCTGMKKVFVNGVLAYDCGIFTHSGTGQFLERG